MKYWKKTVTNLKSHVIDSTAMLAESTPIFAAFETGFAGMSDETSMNARLFAVGLTYLGGMGIAYSKGRDFYRKAVHITDKTKERIQSLNDATYTALFNLVVSPAIYYISGSRDVKEIAMGTFGAMILGMVNGAPMGYAVDTFRDLAGLKKCERPSYPNILKKTEFANKKIYRCINCCRSNCYNCRNLCIDA